MPRLFYEELILDIVGGRSECLGNTLLPGECWQVVKVLDCIWRAVQDYRRHRGDLGEVALWKPGSTFHGLTPVRRQTPRAELPRSK